MEGKKVYNTLNLLAPFLSLQPLFLGFLALVTRPLGDARFGILATSFQQLDVPFRKLALANVACCKIDDLVCKLYLVLGPDNSSVVHQQDQIADGERCAFVRVIERMTDRKRIDGERGDLLDAWTFEPVCQIRLDSSENGADGSAGSGTGQSAISRQQMFMQVGDLLFSW